MGTTSYLITATATNGWHLATTHPYVAVLLVTAVSTLGLVILSRLLFRKPKVPYLEVRSDPKLSFWNRIRTLDWLINGPKLIHDGYDKHRDTIFQVPSQDRTSIVLPPRFLDEIRYLPQSIASNSRATCDV